MDYLQQFLVKKKKSQDTPPRSLPLGLVLQMLTLSSKKENSWFHEYSISVVLIGLEFEILLHSLSFSCLLEFKKENFNVLSHVELKDRAIYNISYNVRWDARGRVMDWNMFPTKHKTSWKNGWGVRGCWA